jgi:hypothetical protein
MRGGRKLWMTERYWPLTFGEPPRLPDGSVDVQALCRQWDDAFNCGIESTLTMEREENREVIGELEAELRSLRPSPGGTA